MGGRGSTKEEENDLVGGGVREVFWSSEWSFKIMEDFSLRSMPGPGEKTYKSMRESQCLKSVRSIDILCHNLE